MRWLLVACLAACSHNSMAIEVTTSDKSIARVELVLVESHCDTCTGDAPPSSLTKATGDVYYQFAGDRFTANVSDGVAGFTLEPGASDEILKLGAIGFDSQGVPKAIALVDQDIRIKQHLGEVFKVDLVTREIQQAVGALPGAFTINSSDAVVVWRAPNAADTVASCIAVLPAATTANGAKATFIVPPVDTDCDGVTGAAECDPFWYLYSKPTDITHPQYCLEQEMADSPCLVGSEIGCVDGQSQAGCHPLQPRTYCVPERACSDCADPTDPQCIDHVGNDSAMAVPRIHCTIPLVGAPGNYTSCVTGVAPVNIDTPFSTLSSGTCMPLFIKAPVTFPIAPMQSVAFDTGQGPVTLMIGAVNMPCEVQIIPMASVASIPSHTVPALVSLHGPTRDMLVPLVVDFTNANQTVCSGAATAAVCTVDAVQFTDPMWTCAKN